MSTVNGDSNRDPSAWTSLTKIHRKDVVQCAFSPDTDKILSGSLDSTVVLWNIPSQDLQLHDDTINDDHKLTCYRFPDEDSVTSIDIHRELFISASIRGIVNIRRFVADNQNQSERINSRTSSSSYIGRGHGRVSPSISFATQYRPNQSKTVLPKPSSYNCSTGIIRSVALSLDGESFATGSGDRIVKIWSTGCKNKSTASYPGRHKNWIKCVRWSKTDRSVLASCGDDGKVCVWDRRDGSRIVPSIELVSKKRMQFNCLDWHPIFGHNIATGAQDSSFSVWDLRVKKQIQNYLHHDGSVNSLAFDPSGSLLLTGSSDQTSNIFDVCRGMNLYKLMCHTGAITSVCFNPTGELFATASRDKTITLWKRNFDTIKIEVLDGDDESTVLEYDDQVDSGQSYLNHQGNYNQPHYMSDTGNGINNSPPQNYRSQIRNVRHLNRQQVFNHNK